MIPLIWGISICQVHVKKEEESEEQKQPGMAGRETCSRGTGFQFGAVGNSGNGEWWWSHNNVKGLNVTELYTQPWLVWLGWLGTVSSTERSLVQGTCLGYGLGPQWRRKQEATICNSIVKKCLWINLTKSFDWMGRSYKNFRKAN